jgi:putative ABC transport system permease protein
VHVRPPEVSLLNKLVFENLRQRPVRTCLSVLAIGVEVTMMLTLVGISYGTLDETARRARGIGADIIVRPPASSIIRRLAPKSENSSLRFSTARNIVTCPCAGDFKGRSPLGSLSSSPMSEKLVPFLMKQPHVTFATGTIGQPLGGFDVLTGIDLAQFNRLSGRFRFVRVARSKTTMMSLSMNTMRGRRSWALEAQSHWQITPGECRESSSLASSPTSVRG